MGKTSIAWCTDVWNPVTGCSKVSAGCKHCYAERVFPRAYAGQTVEVEHELNDGSRIIGQFPRRFTDVMTHASRHAPAQPSNAPRIR